MKMITHYTDCAVMFGLVMSPAASAGQGFPA